MYYYFNDFKVDLFGYENGKYIYSVETPYSSKIRTAKIYYKSPDKRNEWRFPYGDYIYIITPLGKKQRLFIDKYY
jgi:hypothetical protein